MQSFTQRLFELFKGHIRVAFLCVRYHSPMKPPPDTPEFAKFTEALKQVLSVSKTEMQERIEAQKKSGKRLPKRFAYRGPVSLPKRAD